MNSVLAAEIHTSLGRQSPTSEAGILAMRPYVNDKGHSVIAVPTNERTDDGLIVYREHRIQANATLRKDEWITIDDMLHESYRERLVIVDDLMNTGLTLNVGLGTLISEWENASEITDADVSMDGESDPNADRQEFGLNGVPVPVIHKGFSIGERVLVASRQRGGSLDVTTGIESARSVSRTTEKMVFNGGYLGNVQSAANSYTIHGLTNFPNRATFTISDWSDDMGVTEEDILADILSMIQLMETNQRRYGPFRLYIPAEFNFRFYQDFKAESDKTLLQRVLDDPRVDSIRVSDVLADGNVVLVQFDRLTLDLAVGADVNTVQWASGSGWTNHFQTFAIMAPRFKTDFDGRTGILHATVGT